MTPITTKHVERTWTLLTIAGGALMALWTGYSWINDQNVADDVVREEVAPAVKAQARTLTAVRKTLDLLAEDKLATQVAMEQKCEQPNNDMPKDYCSDVLLKKRMRDAHEKAREAVQPEGVSP
jgi:hypothetical protein